MRGILPSISMERVLLVMAKDFKHNGLGFDVFQEGSCYCHSNLMDEKYRYFQIFIIPKN